MHFDIYICIVVVVIELQKDTSPLKCTSKKDDGLWQLWMFTAKVNISLIFSCFLAYKWVQRATQFYLTPFLFYTFESGLLVFFAD